MEDLDHNFRILICIGGGPEAYTGIKFASRFSRESCADIAMLYVRPLDSGLKSGGMEIRVARENLLEWGLELPGMHHLNKARDILVELGQITKEDSTEWAHHELSGDPVGEFIRQYQSPCGSQIAMRLRTASDVTSAVVEEADRYDADLVIVGGSPHPVEGLRKLITPKSLALKIAAHTNRSIIVARHLEPGRGHLVCVQDNDISRAMLPKAIRYSHACNCPTSILSVAAEEAGLAQARKAVDEAAAMYRAAGIEPHELLVETGPPSEVISEIGYDFSLIVLAESEKPWFAKGFSVSHDVAARARNSVLIVK